jgi:hypothetical protein
VDLTPVTAFSSDGAAGRAARVLLELSMPMRGIIWLRMLVIARAARALTNVALAFRERLLIPVTIGQLIRRKLATSRDEASSRALWNAGGP